MPDTAKQVKSIVCGIAGKARDLYHAVGLNRLLKKDMSACKRCDMTVGHDDAMRRRHFATVDPHRGQSHGQNARPRCRLRKLQIFCDKADVSKLWQEVAVLRECLITSGALSPEVFKARLHHKRDFDALASHCCQYMALTVRFDSFWT